MSNILENYEDFVFRACTAPYTKDVQLTAMALAGEVGELIGEIKRPLKGKEFDFVAFRAELGDVLFYLTRTAQLYDITLAELMYSNKGKLERRALALVETAED